MTIYYLYVKTHNKTGLKYLGQTSKQDPYTYMGSGKDWIPHLRMHGFDVSTTIIQECKTKQELNEAGRYYSKLWDVAESDQWANKIPETGGGSCSADAANKISKKLKGVKKPPRTKEHVNNISKSMKGVPKLRSAEHQTALTNSIKEKWKTNYLRKSKTAAVGKANLGRKHTTETLEKKRRAMINYWREKKSKLS
jgi:hypothetical protein